MADEIICPKCGAPNPENTVFCGKCGTRIGRTGEQNAVEDPLLGVIVGDRFLVHEKLGEGGMGVVYRAEQTAIGRTVALKVLHAQLTRDESLHVRFQNEAAASSRLTHPNTVTVFDFGKTDFDSLYIAMEYVEGQSLDDEIRNKGALDWRRACRVAAQICGSLEDAHAHNIVHRDLKPENVMLCERGGERDFVKVLDFGIAKIMEDTGTDQRQALTKTGMVFGTPQYMSPEQIRGERVDHRTDIYSLGVILYQMLAGELPFSAEMPMGVLTKHLMEQPPPLSKINAEASIPASLEALVMATLAKKAEDRPQSMKELAQKLKDNLAGKADEPAEKLKAKAGLAPTMASPSPAVGKQDIKAASPPPTELMSPGAVVASGPGKKSNKGLVIGLLAIAVVVLGGGGAYFLFAGGTKNRSSTPQKIAQTQPPPLNPQLPQVAGVPAGQPSTTNPASPQGDLSEPLAALPEPTVVPASQEKPKSSGKKKKKDDSSKGGGGGIKIDTDTIADLIPPNVDPKNVDPKDVIDNVPVKKDADCRFLGGNDPIAAAIRKKLQANQAAIKECAKKLDANGRSTTKFEFRVPKKTSKALVYKTTSKTPIDGCLKSVLQRDFGTRDEDTRTGDATFGFFRKDNVLVICAVTVNAEKPKKKEIRIPIPINPKPGPGGKSGKIKIKKVPSR